MKRNKICWQHGILHHDCFFGYSNPRTDDFPTYHVQTRKEMRKERVWLLQIQFNGIWVTTELRLRIEDYKVMIKVDFIDLGKLKLLMEV